MYKRLEFHVTEIETTKLLGTKIYTTNLLFLTL